MSSICLSLEHSSLAEESIAFLGAELQEVSDGLNLADAEQQRIIKRVEQFTYPSFIFLSLLHHHEDKSNDACLSAESFAYGILQTSKDFKDWLRKKSAIKTDQRKSKPLEQSEAVLISRKNNNLTITLNQAETRNAYSASMREGLYEALQLLDIDDSIENCLLKGAGDCFCTGGDLSEFGLSLDSAESYLIRQQRNVAGLLLKNASRITCQVQGACIGSGIELAACAGKVIASPKTFFQLPELSMGLIPGAGGTVSILRRIGRLHLAYWVLSGKKINAKTALEWGLVDEVV